MLEEELKCIDALNIENVKNMAHLYLPYHMPNIHLIYTCHHR